MKREDDISLQSLSEILRTTTLDQRLDWLEEMLDLALASGGLAKARALEEAAATQYSALIPQH
jgi:hypothetical protein